MRNEEGNAQRVLGQVRAAQQQWPEAEQLLNDSLYALEEARDTYEAARTRLALAQMRCAQGRCDEALNLIDQCVEVFSRLNAQLDLAAAQSSARAGSRGKSGGHHEERQTCSLYYAGDQFLGRAVGL